MSDRIDDLEPHVAAKCREFQSEMAQAGAPVRITHTRRTWDEQAHFHAKGRTIPGEPCWHSGEKKGRPVGTCKDHKLGATVTNAKPGYSWHNFGLAFDFCFAGKVPYPKHGDPRWKLACDIAQRLGMDSGVDGLGGTKYIDAPHVQLTGGLSLASARAAHEATA